MRDESAIDEAYSNLARQVILEACRDYATYAKWMETIADERKAAYRIAEGKKNAEEAWLRSDAGALFFDAAGLDREIIMNELIRRSGR